MAKVADIQYENNEFVLSGELDFCNVMQIYEKSLALASQIPVLIFNFSKITSCNSAGLALIVEWIKWGERNNMKVQLKSLSPELESIAKVSGLDKLLNI